jgi:isocitrate/isopropylmalate dehydrogenase
MRVAVVPGDGIGREVIPAVLPVLSAVADKHALDIRYETFDWGADRWLAEGVGLPPGAIDMLVGDFDGVLLGALGDPRVPDMAHGRDILLGLRRGLDLYVNYRPVELPGGRIDLYRENTQGLYAGVGGTVRRGALADVAIDECVYTRATVRKFVRYCLEDLAQHGRRKATLVHKANAVPHTGALWLEVFREQICEFPGMQAHDQYVDSFCYDFVRTPEAYQGVLAPNLFGDIISDIGAALMGGLGLAPSASVCPETGFGLFEPVHGSAPDIAGKGIANPYGALMTGALMLRHFGAPDAAEELGRGVRAAAGTDAVTPDLGGHGTTRGFAEKVQALLQWNPASAPASVRDTAAVVPHSGRERACLPSPTGQRRYSRLDSLRSWSLAVSMARSTSPSAHPRFPATARSSWTLPGPLCLTGTTSTTIRPATRDCAEP